MSYRHAGMSCEPFVEPVVAHLQGKAPLRTAPARAPLPAASARAQRGRQSGPTPPSAAPPAPAPPSAPSSAPTSIHVPQPPSSAPALVSAKPSPQPSGGAAKQTVQQQQQQQQQQRPQQQQQQPRPQQLQHQQRQPGGPVSMAGSVASMPPRTGLSKRIGGNGGPLAQGAIKKPLGMAGSQPVRKLSLCCVTET